MISPLYLALENAPARPGGSMMDIIVMFGGVILIMYFLVLRPNKRNEEKRMEMLAAIKKNDKVMTTGDLLGVVSAVREKEVVIKVDEERNVKVRVAIHAIASVIGDEEPSAPA